MLLGFSLLEIVSLEVSDKKRQINNLLKAKHPRKTRMFCFFRSLIFRQLVTRRHFEMDQTKATHSRFDLRKSRPSLLLQ
jgi:hypothetical protein